MIQRRRRGSARPSAAALLIGLLVSLGCDHTPAANTAPAATQSASTVASLSPAATDLILGIVDRERLVAVSNWDGDRPDAAGLPRVGDYRDVDWERLAQLRPSAIVVQIAPEKMPPGLRERAADLGARVVNIHIDRLEDIFTTIRQLGDALNAAGRAAGVEADLRGKLAVISANVKDEPPLRVYLAREPSGLSTVGGDNFLDDLVKIAGGVNVVSGGVSAYPAIDEEKLMQLDPEVIIHLLPAASASMREEAMRRWRARSNLSAVKNSRVHIVDDYFILQPGLRVADTAERFAALLHPNRAAMNRAAP